MAMKVAYIMSRFPHLPETFILREMEALSDLGYEVALYPLITQRQTVVHAAARKWQLGARRVPFISPAVLAENARRAVQDLPGFVALFGRTAWELRDNPKMLVRSLALIPKAVAMARDMHREGVQHIHAHYATHPAFVAWLIHRLTGISYSVTAHAHDIFVQQDMLTAKLQAAAFVVAISEFNREFLAEKLGAWVRAKTHLVRCGVDAAHYLPHTLPRDRSERFEIVSVGSLQPYKGQTYLIEACRLLRAAGMNFRCHIVGSGELRPQLQRQIAAAGLDKYVRLTGALPQRKVARMLSGAHCYVQPSIVTPSGKMEGIPVALMEALACALPVVATSISGVPELVRHGETGCVTPPANARALADAIRAVHADPAAARRRGLAGRNLVLQTFDLRTNVAQLAKLFDRVAPAAAPAAPETGRRQATPAVRVAAGASTSPGAG